MKKIKIITAILICVLFSTSCTSVQNKTEEPSTTEQCTEKPDYLTMPVAKPVIYLYPNEELSVSVKLDYKGQLTCTYPEYLNGWDVIAKPNGTIKNTKDNKEYSYLYWEGTADANLDMSKGFVVAGSDTVQFLQEKLAYMGLIPREYNEFIVYWLPILQENKYNLITFAGKDYEELAKLTVCPQPDSMLRVMMLYKPLEEFAEIEEQNLEQFTRTGFTVVEWGGAEIQ